MTASTQRTIVPVILCGGSGTRLWPLSRKGYPKQFGRILGSTSLFQASVLRLPEPEFAKPVIVTGGDFRFIATEQLGQIGRAASTILIEPEGRNTGPAILAAAMHVAQNDPGAILLVCPSDHAISDAEAFRRTVRAGLRAADDGQLVTFGVRPTRAETGYGWLELDAAPQLDGDPSPCPLARFVEKPCAEAAAEMLASGRHLWNAGIFLFSAEAILSAFAAHAPALCSAVAAAHAGATQDLGFRRLDAVAWAEVESISVDYAVMEHARNLVVVPFVGTWSDLGSWDAIAREMEPDADGVATSGATVAIDCENSLLRAEDPDQVLVGIGLKGVVAIAMRDAVLVANLCDGQRVREAVEILKARRAPQAVDFPRFHRPWGWYETLALDARFQVKRIMVHPGGILSLQSHMHRAEHWVVVQGTARVTVGEDVRLLTENQSVYIPLGTVHRLENPGKVDLHLIEVQSGPYLGEDDILRYEDIYARS